jgi:hypothetical protein
MRELSKSMLSLSWALSLLGIKQGLSLMTPGSGGRGRVTILDPITETAVGQLDDSMKGIFRSGDALQSKAIDMMFGMLDPGNWNLINWMSSCGCSASNKSNGPSSYDCSPATNVTPVTGNVTTNGSAAGWAPMSGDNSGS